jgi:NAD(P)-dependent dehydrogenase (short-subunit alcohol dehydrogenase family)
MELKDTVALITGGGSGLGEATAREFVTGGGKVVILDLPNSTGPALADSFGSQGLFVAADVASGDAVEKAIAQSVDRFGALHIAVNCAGIGKAQRTVGKDGPHSLELFTRVLQVNLIGTFNVIRLAASQMSRNHPNSDGERGVIINTASIAAFDGQIGQGRLFGVERRRGRPDAASRPRPGVDRDSRMHNCTGNLRYSDASDAARTRAACSRRTNSLPVAPWSSGRIRFTS